MWVIDPQRVSYASMTVYCAGCLPKLPFEFHLRGGDFMNIVVIGAGATGLTATWELVKAGHQVTLIEAHDQVGGLAAGFRLPRWDWWLDKFYHHWFASDADILQLIDEIGCSHKL